MLIDTHCHLNFSRFKTSVGVVIDEARATGVGTIVVPATDVQTAHRALEIAQQHQDIYVAVGIHPHHVFEFCQNNEPDVHHRLDADLRAIAALATKPSVVAIGEVGLDCHYYTSTKYDGYEVNESFIELQEYVFVQQIRMSIANKKSLIIHNREAKDRMLTLLEKEWDPILARKSVFHCCEPDEGLLAFAKEHQMFIGIDGDVTYDLAKREFCHKIPDDMLVLETDAPFLLPEPYRTKKDFPNKPSRLYDIATYVADVRRSSFDQLAAQTSANAMELFGLAPGMATIGTVN